MMLFRKLSLMRAERWGLRPVVVIVVMLAAGTGDTVAAQEARNEPSIPVDGIDVFCYLLHERGITATTGFT